MKITACAVLRQDKVNARNEAPLHPNYRRQKNNLQNSIPHTNYRLGCKKQRSQKNSDECRCLKSQIKNSIG